MVGFITAARRDGKIQTVYSYRVEEALNHFTNTKHGLMIAGIFMDGMGGIEGITEIRKRRPNARIMAISAA